MFFSPFRAICRFVRSWPKFSAILLALAYLNFSSDANAASWRFVGANNNTSNLFSVFSAPPVCQRYFATKEDALECLRGKQTDAYYVEGVAAYSDRKSVYGNFFEKYSSTIVANQNMPSYATCKHPDGGNVPNSNCYIVAPSHTGGSGAGGGNAPERYHVIYLTDANGNALNNQNGDRILWTWRRNSLNWSISGSYASSVNGGYVNYNPSGGAFKDSCGGVAVSPFTACGGIGITFGLAYFPDKEPDIVGPENSCVGKYRRVSVPRALYGDSGPPIGEGLYDTEALCDYTFVDITTEPRFANAGLGLTGRACLSPFPSETKLLCVVVGERDIIPPATSNSGEMAQRGVAEVNAQTPLQIEIGDDDITRALLRQPTVAEKILGWGNTWSTVTMGGSLIAATIPYFVEKWDNGLSERQLALYQAYVEEDIIDLKAKYEKQPDDLQDYYHHGNHNAAGENIKAFDRDWGKTEYDEDKAWNWDPNTPASATSKENLEVTTTDPLTGAKKVVSTATAQANGQSPKYPPSFPNPDGSVNAPTDGIAGTLKDAVADGIGEAIGKYEQKGSLYESKYPDGLGGALSGLISDAQSSEGISEALGAITFNGSSNIVGDLCFGFPVEVLGVDYSSAESRLCIPDSILNIIRGFLILGASIYAIRLIFGGD